MCMRARALVCVCVLEHTQRLRHETKIMSSPILPATSPLSSGGPQCAQRYHTASASAVVSENLQKAHADSSLMTGNTSSVVSNDWQHVHHHVLLLATRTMSWLMNGNTSSIVSYDWQHVQCPVLRLATRPLSCLMAGNMSSVISYD